MPFRLASAAFVETGRLAGDEDLAGVGLVDAAQNLHQRRLAGAVLADQADDLAGPDLDRDVLQRVNAGEALVDPDHRQGRVGRLGVHLTIRISLRSIDSATAPMIIRPWTPICTLGGTPISTMPFDRTDDDQHADEGLQDAALAARQRGAADDDRGDGGEQAAVADLGVAEAELRRGENAADRVEDAGQREGRRCAPGRPECRTARRAPRRRRARKCSGRGGCSSG